MSTRCLHPDVSIQEWDHGRDPETGYQDAGVRITCRACGEVFEDSEFRQELERIEAELNKAPAPGAIYTAIGMRLFVLAVTEDQVSYICRCGDYTSPALTLPLSQFIENQAQGLIALEGRAGTFTEEGAA